MTSLPPEAMVILDGKNAGRTPLTLRLDRYREHVVRIEKEGYKPARIRFEINKHKYAARRAGQIVVGITLALVGAALGG
ncbi:MAG: PEGA domain-containing protein [Candidatus Saccharicenans sp.]|nr:PEGA domain-containing protein [Candidatus Saccharicenans sp.]